MNNRKQQISRLYKLILNREPDTIGLNNYLKSDSSLVDIQHSLWSSDEFRSKFNYNLTDTSPLDNDLPIFIINLERRVDRKQLVEGQLNQLGIKKYEFLNAVDAQTLPEDLSDVYDEATSMRIIRKLTRAEVACGLSHVEAAKKIVEENLPYALIFEDDVRITNEFKQFMVNFKSNNSYDFDVLLLGLHTSNEFYNGKLKTKDAPYKILEYRSIVYLDKIEYMIGNSTVHKPHYPSMYLDFLHGAHAYILSNSGARKIIELNTPIILQADSLWNTFIDEIDTKVLNPLVCHYHETPSDIQHERDTVDHDWSKFSEEFLRRKYHDDFGT